MSNSGARKLITAAALAAAAGTAVSVAARSVMYRKTKCEFDIKKPADDKSGENFNVKETDKHKDNKDDKYNLDKLVGKGAADADYEVCFRLMNKLLFRLGRSKALVEKYVHDNNIHDTRIFSQLQADLSMSEFMTGCIANSIKQLYGSMYTGNKNPELKR